MSKYIVDDVASGVQALDNLLEVICEIQFQLSVGEKDNRLDSLLWIARDVSNGIVAGIEKKDETITVRKRMEAQS